MIGEGKGLIQVAGIMDLEEARMLMEAGVDRLGFPFKLDIHEEDISEGEAAEIIKTLHLGDSAVLITYLQDASRINRLCRELGLSTVQIHSEIPLEEMVRLRKSNPDLQVIKSLIVKQDNLGELLVQLEKYGDHVDAFLTDTYDPNTGASGATGKTHDWFISRQIVLRSNRPVILAGGLNPENVAAAVRIVRPAGVDVHTGVEDSSGRKNLERVKKFVREARKSFADRA